MNKKGNAIRSIKDKDLQNELNKRMSQMFYAILHMVSVSSDGKLYPCDLEELYNAYGYNIKLK